MTLAKNLDLNQHGPKGATPLHVAARFGQGNVAAILLDMGADPKLTDHKGKTPANKARDAGQVHLLQLLKQAQTQTLAISETISYSSSITKEDGHPLDATLPAALNFPSASPALDATMVPSKSKIDKRCRPLFEATFEGQLQNIATILRESPQLVHVRGPRGATALHVAARYGQLDAVDLLLEACADTGALDDSGNTPADKARQFRHEAVEEKLLSAAASATNTTLSASPPVMAPDENVHVRMDTLHAENIIPSVPSLEMKNPDAPPPSRTQDMEEPEVTPDKLLLLPPTEAEKNCEVVFWKHCSSEEALLEFGTLLQPAESASRAFWLVGTSGNALGSTVRVVYGMHTREAPLTIGRHRSSGMLLTDGEVSSQHAIVWWEKAQENSDVDPILYVADSPGSFNGTFIRLSGERERSALFPLNCGDVVYLGEHSLVLQSDSGGSSQEATHLAVTSVASPPAAESIRTELEAERVVLTLGRAKSNVVMLPDQKVSGSHAELRRDDSSPSGWAISDIGSSNGTFVRLSAERAPSRPFPVFPGQSITIGVGAKSSELCVTRCLSGASARRGRRATMEDEHVCLHRLLPPAGVSLNGRPWPLLTFFAVYDGHGGAGASAYCKQNLHAFLAQRIATLLAAKDDKVDDDDHAGEKIELSLGELALALHDVFLETDEKFISTSVSGAGTTAVVALLADDHILVANAGDSRAQLWRDGRPILMSVDHKPARPDETARINAAGGFVAHGRVMHALAVSRALGDREFKKCDFDDELPFTDSLVIPDPEIRVCRIAEGDELLIACDGLWDVMDAQEAFTYLHSCDGLVNPQRAIHELTQHAEVDLNSSDNITAVYALL